MSDRDRKIYWVVYKRPLPGRFRNLELGVTYHLDDDEETRNAKLAKALKDALFTVEEADKMGDALPVQVVPEVPPGAAPTQEASAPQAPGKTCPTCKGPMKHKSGESHVGEKEGKKQFIEVNGEMVPKMKAWAGWFCEKSGNRIPQEERCSQEPQWEGKKG